MPRLLSDHRTTSEWRYEGRPGLPNGVEFWQLHISRIVIALQEGTSKVENNSIRKHREHDTVEPWGALVSPDPHRRCYLTSLREHHDFQCWGSEVERYHICN